MRRHRLELRYLAIAAVLIGGLILLDRLDAFSGLDDVMQDAVDSSKDIGVVAVFAIALVANLALLVQVPYTLPLLAAALAGGSTGHMVVLGLAAGLGAAIGGMCSYLLAEKVLARNPALEQSRLFQWVTRATTSRPRLAALVVFICAATPLPDDVVIIPFAMVRHGARKIALPLFTGKIVHNVAVALIFYQFTAWSASSASTHVRADLVVGVVVLFVLAILYQAEKARSVTKLPAERAAADVPAPSFALGHEAHPSA